MNEFQSTDTQFGEAVAHHMAGRLDDAAAGYNAILTRDPSHAEAHCNLGIVFQSKGRYEEAEAKYRRALEIRPGYAEAHVNLGFVLHALRRPAESEASCRRAIGLRPDFVEAHLALGNALRDLGRLAEAEASFHRAIELRPGYAKAHLNLGSTLRDLARLPEAEASCRRATELAPGYAEAYLNLGSIQRDLGRFEESVASCRRALEIRPEYADAHIHLGNAMRDLGRLAESEACYRRALELNPDSAGARLNLGNTLRELGRLDDALVQLEGAIAADSGYVAAHKSLLATLTYLPSLTPERSFAAHRRFECATAAKLGRRSPAQDNRRDPARRLKIGYLSADLRDHSAARNLLPLIEAHDRSSFEIHLYANVVRPDALTARFRALADGWRSTVGLDDSQVADVVQSDSIDILVCLAGRFDGNRPLVCARRPAPVQISSHDVATSGLTAIDYLISDPVLTPRNTPERFTERLLRLPNFYLAEMPRDLPPARPNVGPVTFGCFNNPAKITDPALDLWARLLAGWPDSRLLLRYNNWYESGSVRERVLASLERHGVVRSRVAFPAAAESRMAHLRIYNEIDVALDTFPFSGSTTTFEALVMGVPVVTLPGWSMVSRWSATMLHALGLDELIADSLEAYLQIAGRVANDREKLAALRCGLRDRVARSSLCDAPRKARQMERFYRATWRRWCASPESKRHART